MSDTDNNIVDIEEEDAQDTLLQFVQEIDFVKQNVSLDLTAEEFACWDNSNVDQQRAFREDVIYDLIESAEHFHASYGLIFDAQKRILLIARYDNKIEDWITIETDDNYRPKDSEIFKI